MPPKFNSVPEKATEETVYKPLVHYICVIH